jgi:hypothetical protein
MTEVQRAPSDEGEETCTLKLLGSLKLPAKPPVKKKKKPGHRKLLTM